MQRLTFVQRDRAWAVFHYPCIGRYRFLTFNLVDHPLYERHVLPVLRAPAPSNGDPEPIFLDIGTCLGQDLRVLLHSGVPASRIYATDIEPKFAPLGYELFRDQETFPASHQIAPVDLFDTSNFDLNGRLQKFLKGVDILHISAVFHLFNYNDQVTIGKNIIDLLRRSPMPGKEKGSVIFGSQTANVKPTEYEQRAGGKGRQLYRHNIESWENMWLQVITKDGTVEDEDGGKYRLRPVTILSETHPRMQLKGLEGDLNDKGGPNADPGFRWMKFEVWFEPLV